MFGLDESIASLSDGTAIWVVVVVAILLGFRHALDPDHLAAMSTLIAGGRDRAARRAAGLGFAWGLGHGTTVFAFGLPIVLFDRYIPERAGQFAETAVAVLIVYLAIRLLARWRHGDLHVHVHEHDGEPHVHLHSHGESAAHVHHRPMRTPLGAYGIGLVHGVGGSAGVGILIVATVASPVLSVVALLLLAVFTAVSMTVVTGGFGAGLVSRPARAAWGVVAPALALASLTFGVWYAGAAWNLIPHAF